MDLVLTMCAITLGQMLGFIFRSVRTALIVFYFVTIYSIICSGALLNLKDSNNAIFKKLGNFSPFRFSTEEFMRQVIESNDHPDADGYLDSFDYKYKIQDYPFITQWSIIFFCISWVIIIYKVKVPKAPKV